MPAMWAIVQKSVLENEPHSVEEEVDERSMFRKATVSDPSPPLSLATGGEAAASLCAVMPSTLPTTVSKPFLSGFPSSSSARGSFSRVYREKGIVLTSPLVCFI